MNTSKCHSLNGIKREQAIGESTSREQTMDLTISKREFGVIVLIHLVHYREELFLKAHTTRFKTIGLLRIQTTGMLLSQVVMEKEPFLQKTTRLGDLWDLSTKTIGERVFLVP